MAKASCMYPSDFGAGNMVTQMSGSGLDTLAEGSRYALQQLQHERSTKSLNGPRPEMKHRPSNSNSSIDGMNHAQRESMGKGGNTANGQPVRRRISRACDQCNQLRTKCDGQTPCAHCVEFGLTCEYARERKKRGKASRKDIAAQQAAAAGDGAVQEITPRSTNGHSCDDMPTETPRPAQQGVKRRRSTSSRLPPPQLPPPPRSNPQQYRNGHHTPLPSMEQSGSMSSDQNGHDQHIQTSLTIEAQASGLGLPTPRLPNVGMSDRGMSVAMGDYGTIDDYHRSILHPGATVAGHNILHSGTTAMPASMILGGAITGYGDSQYAASPGSQNGVSGAPFRIGESPLSGGFLGNSPMAGSPMAGSPGWLSLPSPSAGLYSHLGTPPQNQVLRYPVLRPLLPHISAIIPIGLACDLLELYFASTSSTFMRPQSPYVLGYILRKRSFLRQQNPRVCSPALLASMLWVAAQTSKSAFLTSPPSARGKICQKLLELTYGLLKPLVHTSNDAPSGYGAHTVINGVALGGFGVALGHGPEMEGGSPGATGALDDVATYIHLATVVSASEYKAASLRWWNAAWSLARELKLGRELPPNPSAGDGEAGANDNNINESGGRRTNGDPPGSVSEEEREERRRIWWLLYIVDRHLALCYNKPLFLLDIECDRLLQPENETVWQAGEFYPSSDNHAENTYFRRRGPIFECGGHSIYAHFLPLMTILGEIVDMKHARDHPRFGLRFHSAEDWDAQAAEISQQLDAYERSLKDFEARYAAPPSVLDPQLAGDGPATTAAANDIQQHHHDETSPSAQSISTNNSNPNLQQPMTSSHLRTKIVVAYGTHLLHTLHILLNGKWDPISLLDDNDLWISSPSFVSATSHAVAAAAAIDEILDYDPDLSFMPFFFGIYLLQGSFLLLLIADKLQGDASPSVVKACETIVRAHEACVVTLDTEYQRNFRKVMRSALSQVRGRSPEGFGEQQLRRREVLALYRWTGDGSGLAL